MFSHLEKKSKRKQRRTGLCNTYSLEQNSELGSRSLGISSSSSVFNIQWKLFLGSF